MRGTVHFLIQGSFGDNLFQYFAAELMKKIYEYEAIKPTFQMQMEFQQVIDDEKFKAIMLAYLQGHPIQLDVRKDILLVGFFQRSEIFTAERDFVRSLFNAENMHHISNRIQIGNIVKYQTKQTVQPTAQDLTLHLRCGELWDHARNRSQIVDPALLKEIVKSIPHEKLYIVSEKPAHAWEKEYYDHFEELNPTWIRGNLGDEFDFLLKSSKLITSTATMSWLAAYLGNAEEVHIPYNTFYGGAEGYEQSLADFNEKCKVYHNITYWTPTTPFTPVVAPSPITPPVPIVVSSSS
jgi:hypothetical protein